MTKFHIPPLRKSTVIRPRLMELLDRGLDSRLILVCAPAGFGKSTLISSWIHGLRSRDEPPMIAWLSLDENENDLKLFLVYLISALRTLVDNYGESILPLLESAEDINIEKILTILLNEVTAFSGTTILVLDDYHLIESTEIDRALSFFIDHLPDQFHLVISSRIDPSIPLSRLRGRGQMVELRSRDLRFNIEETSGFFATESDIEFSEPDLDTIYLRTEGWIAGLQLLALSLHESDDYKVFIDSFVQSNRYILDYLGDEVLERQPETVRNFLLQTSVLHSLSGPLCKAVTGNPDSGKILEELLRRNLFIIPLDNDSRQYRYHHLFSDLLKHNLRHNHPDMLPVLHEKASRWYMSHNFYDEAFNHALMGDNKALATEILERRWQLHIYKGELTRLRRKLDSLGPLVIEKSAPLSMACCWLYNLTESYEKIPAHLENVRRLLRLRNDKIVESPGLQYAVLPSLAETIEAAYQLSKGNAESTLVHANKAISLIPSDAPVEVQGTLNSSALLYLAFACQLTGDLETACSCHLQNMELMKISRNQFGAVNSLMELSQIYRKLKRTSDTILICGEMIDFFRQEGWTKFPPAGIVHLVLASAQYETGDTENAGYNAGIGKELLSPIMNSRYENLVKSVESAEGSVLSKPGGLIEPLSKREMEILRLISEGLSNDEICERLFLALSTVKGHNQNIYGKLQVERRTEAVARARELGIIQ